MVGMAITRGVSPAIQRCELTHLARVPIDTARAGAQHGAYEACLASLGCAVHRLPAEPDLPDAVFVEDTAVVLDEVAIMMRPGAESRRAETLSVETALSAWRSVLRIEAPATIDGGDVLLVGRTLYLGLSTRTNRAALHELRALVSPYGYRVVGVEVRGCLHLKSAATALGPETVLLNRSWLDEDAFEDLRLVDVDTREPQGANVLLIDRAVVCAAAFPRTAERLQARGLDVRLVDVSELAKAEGAVTCCSLIVPLRPSMA